MTNITSYGYDPAHPVFRTPPPETMIWRYTPLSPLLSLLESRRLHLSRASRFLDDPYEGTITVKLEADLVKWEAAVGFAAEASAHLRAQRARAREIVAVSCWHMSPHETEGMWFRYGKDDECVAIRSTVGRLGASFPQHQSSRQKHLESVYLGAVDYVDFTSDTWPPYNVFYPFVHKRREYWQEQEVRAVAIISDAAAAAGATAEFEVRESGLLLPVDVGTLIDAVVLSPKSSASFERNVRASLDRVGLESTPLRKSALAGKPIY